MKAKRILAALTAMAACSAMMGLTAFAEENVLPDNGAALYEEADITAESDVAEPEVYGASITSGDYTYTLSDSGEATITKYSGPGGNVEIPAFIDGNPVVSVYGNEYFGGGAFYNRDDIVNVTIPNGVRSIGNYCFNGCDNLTVVKMPDTLISIGNGAFYNCGNIFSIDIPSSVTSIGERAFDSCDSLVEVSLPDTLLTIGNSAFYSCDYLAKITIPNSVTTIGRSAFSGCSSLKSIEIPDSVSILDEFVFNDCSSLESVTLPASLSAIKSCAFQSCKKLNSIILPPSVLTIDKSAFSICQNATVLYPETAVIKDFSYSSSQKPAAILTYTITDGVATITSVTSSLKEITLPDDIYGTPIGYFTADYVGKVNHKHYPESGCTICPSVETPVERFVERLYTVVLDRPSDPVGKANHVENLLLGKSACDVAYDFVFSKEFLEGGLSNEEVVTRMYRTFLDREPDESGFLTWKKALDNGCSYAAVMYGFSQSKEFGELCGKYGIVQGTFKLTENRDQSANLTAFVNRLYNKTLGRNGEPDGLNSHTGAYLQDRNVERLAYNFVFSPEFTNKNHSNEEFVEIMYQAFFGRDSDPVGRENWLSVLANGGSRYDVFLGFIGSQECKELVESFGI